MEIFVKKLKRSLYHKFSSAYMFLLELETCFKKIAAILTVGQSMLDGGHVEEMIQIIYLL